VLDTKLYVPRPRPDAVVRTRLHDRLDQGSGGGLILLSAPAGFGKTTVISAWVDARPRREPAVRTAWPSLDDGDNDPVRFLTYLLAAVRTVGAHVGEELFFRCSPPGI